jgi:flagellar basal-body rod modification protein FlgD
MTADALTTAHAAAASPAASTPAAAGADAANKSSTSATPENPSGVLGQNDFLKLMIAQLQAQNPLEPGNSNEYLNELAQFTQVEQMTNMANANELSGAVQMIGRNVSYNGTSGALTTGTVESVQSSSTGTTVTVGGVAGITLSSLTNVE